MIGITVILLLVVAAVPVRLTHSLDQSDAHSVSGREVQIEGSNRAEQATFTAEPGFVERPVKLTDEALAILKNDERVQVCLLEIGTPDNGISSWFVASEVHLNEDRMADLVVFAKNPCLFGANIIPFWVLRNGKQGYRLALQVSALRLDVKHTRTQGYRDISTSALVQARTVVTVLFEFDGKAYRRRSFTEEPEKSGETPLVANTR